MGHPPALQKRSSESPDRDKLSINGFGRRRMLRRRSIGIHLLRAGLCAGMSSCLLAISPALADPQLPLSVLVLDQSASLRPWSTAIIRAIQSSMSSNSAKPISYYVEHLDLYDFYGPGYEDNLRNHFSDKYRNKPIGLILSIGPDALDLAVALRAAVWPAVPVAFTAVDEEALPKNEPCLSGFYPHPQDVGCFQAPEQSSA